MDRPGTRGSVTHTGRAVPLAGLFFVCVATVIGLLAVPLATAQAGAVGGTLHTSDAVLASDGSLTLSTDQASLDLRDIDQPTAVVLQADRLIVNLSWKRGVDNSPPGELVLLREADDQGHRLLEFEDATVRLDQVKPTTQILAYTDRPSVDLTTTNQASTRLDIVEDRMVAAAGSSPNNTNLQGQEPVGFRHPIKSPVVWAQSQGTATLDGAFDVFTNNLTLTIDHADGTWTNWSGYREEQGPAFTKTFERRIIQLEIPDGRLEVASPVGLDLYAPNLVGDLAGTLSAPQAYGLLTTPAGAVELDGQPLQLDGTGHLEFNTDAHPDTVPDSAGLGDGPLLRIAPDGRFELTSPQPLTPTASADGPGGVWAALPLSPWLIATLALILLGGAVAYPWASLEAREAYHRWRQTLFKQRMHHGYRLLEQGNRDGASQAFDSASRWIPDDGVAFHGLAEAQSLAGQPEAALAVLDRAAEKEVYIAPADELDLRTVCYVALGQDDQALETLVDLARVSPRTAAHVVADLDLWELVEGVEALESLGSGNRAAGGGLDGYA